MQTMRWKRHRLVMLALTGAVVLGACTDQPRLFEPGAVVDVEEPQEIQVPPTTVGADAAIQDVLDRILPALEGGPAVSRMTAALESVSQNLARGQKAALPGSLRAAEAALENLERSVGVGMDAEIEAIRLALDEAARQ